MNLEARATKIANDAVKRAQWSAGIIAAAFSILITVLSQVLPYYLGGIEELKRNYAVAEQQIENLKQEVSNLSKVAKCPPARQQKHGEQTEGNVLKKPIHDAEGTGQFKQAKIASAPWQSR